VDASIVLRYPLPFLARESNPYSYENKHEGIDFASPVRGEYDTFHGTSVLASHSGKVVTGYSQSGYGVYVYLMSSCGRFATLYAHLSEIFPADGHVVVTGQPIGRVGYSGRCIPPGIRGTHLHYGFRFTPVDTTIGLNGYIDPASYLERM